MVSKMGRVGLILLASAVCVGFADSALPADTKEPAVVRDIAAGNGDVGEKALDDLTGKSRQAIIDALVARLNNAPLTGETKDDGVVRTMIALGRLRAEVAARPLASRMGLIIPHQTGFAPGLTLPPFTPDINAVVQQALVSIGKASLDPVFHDYADTRQDALGHANVIVSVLDDDSDLAKAWLSKRTSSSLKKAADELIAAIDARRAERKQSK